ncbi:hypothetical protein [Chryseobacterium hagamense]|uniref:Uncharacterized protein n=1 Tax=Chryseobacterium hagamense TaxID=395935 RepID=A0A511YKL7_9FLAO|nr:hypothetical protein [Chryseobacterium hagamense]GEN75747.1 hypothetical protein CHA01nite_14870 [Chryseobacterium hagamense]
MKTIRNTIEQQIKQQIEAREIAPSRDLWSEIKSQSTAGMPKPSYNWLLIAACFILTFSLGAVLFFNQERKPGATSEHIVQTITKPATRSAAEPIAREQHTGSIAENRRQDTATENISAGMKSEAQEKEIKASAGQEEVPVIRQNSAQIISEISSMDPGKTMAQADSAKLPVTKKRYVDPSTLLFSVEHKDVIEKTKGKSNVATIDLNGN